MKQYYHLIKPGIVYGNTIVAVAGFLYAGNKAPAGVDWLLGVSAAAGLACIIASACVFNNYFDREIDKKMERTKNRALASGLISIRQALIFGSILLCVGVAVLYFFTTPMSLAVALAGFCVYVFAYTPLKHYSPYALFVGAVAGATPPLVGYTAVTNMLDSTAWLMGAFLFVWQLFHFLAIAVYRNDEYVAAGVPLFMKGPYTAAHKKLAQRIFYLSLLVLLAWCVALILQR